MALPLPSPNHMDPQAQPPRRLPKLSYRNKQSDADSINTVSTDASRMTASTNLTSPVQSTFCPSPREPPAELLVTSPFQPLSPTSSTTASKPLKNPAKKRPSFFASLFSAKEPSAQAFAEYEKRLMKQGPGRTSTGVLPGVSSAKLPPTVPKVNSKWDGVPETLREREKQKQEFRQSMTGHSRGLSTTRSAGSDSRPLPTPLSQKRVSRGTLGGVSTHSSSRSTNRLADLYGWEVNLNNGSSSSSAVVDFAAEHRPTTARLQTSHSAPAPLERPPPLEKTFLFPPRIPPYRPTSSRRNLEQSPPSMPGSPDVPTLSHSPALTPAFDSSPVTPGAPPKVNPEFPQSKTSEPDDIRTTVLDAPSSVDEVIIKSAGLNILGPPATAKRRAKVSPGQPSDRPKTSGLDMPLTSILKKEPAKDPSSYFPSSGQALPIAPVRRNSARDRLGLGMSLRNQSVAPWSSLDLTGDNGTEGERITTPTPEGGQSAKKKSRMSMFKK